MFQPILRAEYAQAVPGPTLCESANPGGMIDSWLQSSMITQTIE